MEQLLYKNRSVSSCIAEGYKLYRTNMFNIIRNTWKENIAASIASGLLIMAALRMSETTAGIITIITTTLALLASLFLYKRKVFAMVNENPLKWGVKGLFRHFGLAVSMTILSSILMLVIMSVVCLPLIIAISASVMDTSGIATGDTTGLPEHFNTLLFITSTATMCILLHIQVWQTFAVCLAHGAAVTREKKQ